MTTIDLKKFKEIVNLKTGVIPIIRIVGLGGAGINAVNCMIENGVRCTGVIDINGISVQGNGRNSRNDMTSYGIRSVDYITIDCNANLSWCSKAERRIQIGENLTKGLGTQGNLDIGQQAAEESKDLLIKYLQDSDIVFIVAGMGGGLGTGAAPVVAECAKQVGALTVGVVTKPFSCFSQRKMTQAEAGIAKLKERVDMLVTLTDDCLLSTARDLKFNMLRDAFLVSDYALRQGVQTYC